MDAEFWKAAGTAFGLIGGGAAIGLAVRIGASWNDLSRNAKEAKDCAVSTQTSVLEDICPRLQRVEDTLHGPTGDNGLYQTVREIERALTSDRRSRNVA